MQKTAGAVRARAFSLLRSALPEDFRVRVLHEDGDAPSYVVESDKVQPFAIRLAVEDEPVPTLRDTGTVLVLVLRGRSPRDRDELRRAGQSFIDLAGAVHVRAPGFYLDRTNLTPPPRIDAGRPVADPYSDKASRIARALLAAPSSRRWSTQGLANAAEVDASTASRVVRELRRRELVRDENPGQGRRSRIWVPDPEALLRDWTRSYRWTDNAQIRVAAPIGSLRRFLPRMPDLLAGERWALSLHAGAYLIAPHAEFDAVHVYVAAESLEACAISQGWEITSSGRLWLMEPVHKESVWYRQQTGDGTPVVSTVQLVLDLWHYPVRGREQAEHLVETVLRPIWEAGDEPP